MSLANHLRGAILELLFNENVRPAQIKVSESFLRSLKSEVSAHVLYVSVTSNLMEFSGIPLVVVPDDQFANNQTQFELVRAKSIEDILYPARQS